eukprot:6173698-Pleurochrysis_carterae.AAC.1
MACTAYDRVRALSRWPSNRLSSHGSDHERGRPERPRTRHDVDMVVRLGGVDRQATRAAVGEPTRRLASAPRDDSPFEQSAPSVEWEH